MTFSAIANEVLTSFYCETFQVNPRLEISNEQMFDELDSIARLELHSRFKAVSLEIDLEKILRARDWASLFEERINCTSSTRITEDEGEGEKTPTSLLFVIWTYFVFGSLLLVALVIISFPIPPSSRRWIVHILLRAMFAISGIKISLEGTIPHKQLILVSNHESYFDSLILYAGLPPRFLFIAKKELTRYLFLNHFLLRIGTYFVDREDYISALNCVKAIRQGVKESGDSQHFFPEGTFKKKPGLLPFRHGAFYIAAKEAIPIVPILIIGARQALPPGSWLPRRRGIIIRIGTPIFPASESWEDIVKLRMQTRLWLSRELV